MNHDELFQLACQHFTTVQFSSAAELQRLQTTKLRNILRHVVDHIPLYRDLYREHGVSIGEIARADDLWRLPAVEKRDYLEAGPERYVDSRHDLTRLYTKSTSGSLGKSLMIFTSRDEGTRMRANLWSAWLGLGIAPEDRLFMMAAPYLERKVEPYRSDFAPVQMSTDETIARFRALRPTAVIGSVECIALLAAELGRRDVPERHGVRRIFPFGQTLSHQLRQMIGSGFDAQIHNLYGATEPSWMAYECEHHDGMHINVDRVVIQIAKFGKPDEPAAAGELGEIIITSLMRSTTPFVRYRLMDAGAIDLTPCPCGRKAPRLKSLEGRVQDFLLSTGGRLIGPGNIAIDLTDGGKDASIIDHRVVQETPTRARVSIVPGPGFGPPNIARIEQVIRNHLGEVSVTVEQVDEIPREPSGKRRRIFRAFDL